MVATNHMSALPRGAGEHTMTTETDTGKIKKVSIVCSKGSLEGVYPALIMANGARMEGIEASVFFTFFGLYAILKKFNTKIKIATVGNPAMRVPDAKGFPLPTWMGSIPGMSADTAICS